MELLKNIYCIISAIVNGSTHTKSLSLINKTCMTQPTLTNLHPNKYSQEFLWYLFTIKLDTWVGSCNNLSDLSNIVFVPNKTKDLDLSTSNIIRGTN